MVLVKAPLFINLCFLYLLLLHAVTVPAFGDFPLRIESEYGSVHDERRHDEWASTSTPAVSTQATDDSSFVDVDPDMFTDAGSDGSSDYEQLDHYQQHPLQLCGVSERRISVLPEMTARWARIIVRQVRNRAWLSVRELCDSIGIEDPLRTVLILCTRIDSMSFDPHASSERASMSTSVREIMDKPAVFYRLRAQRLMETARGEREGVMLGNAWDVTQRLRISFARWDAAVLASKDAYEASMIDHLSGYVACTPDDVTTLIIGDFTIDEGLGSLTSRSIRQSKGSNVIGVCTRTGGGLRPAVSSLPLRLYRGLAAERTMELGPASLRCWGAISGLPRYGRVDSVTGSLRSLDLSGLRRTPSEVNGWTPINEGSKLCGLDLRMTDVRISAALMHRSYDIPVATDDDGEPQLATGLYSSVCLQADLIRNDAATRSRHHWDEDAEDRLNSSDVSRPVTTETPETSETTRTRPMSRQVKVAEGATHHVASYPVNASPRIPGAVWCAVEVTRDVRGRHAFIASCVMERKSSSLALRLRRAHPRMLSPMGSMLSEFGSMRNEEGLYVGFSTRPSPRLQLRSYMDVYRSITPRFGMTIPSQGMESLCESLWRLPSNTALRLRYTYHRRNEGMRDRSDVLRSCDATLNALRIIIEQQCSASLHCSMRCDMNSRQVTMQGGSHSRSGGSALGMTLDWTLSSWLRLTSQATLFSTDGFDNSVYLTEAPAPGLLRLYPLYNDGVRYSLTLGCTPHDALHAWLRAELVEKNSTRSMGSGITETMGPRQHYVMLQLELRL